MSYTTSMNILVPYLFLAHPCIFFALLCMLFYTISLYTPSIFIPHLLHFSCKFLAHIFPASCKIFAHFFHNHGTFTFTQSLHFFAIKNSTVYFFRSIEDLEQYISINDDIYGVVGKYCPIGSLRIFSGVRIV